MGGIPAHDNAHPFLKLGVQGGEHAQVTPIIEAFTRAALLKGGGFKYGRWTDSILMQRALGAGPSKLVAGAWRYNQTSFKMNFDEPNGRL
jgi:hypothetical protein